MENKEKHCDCVKQEIKRLDELSAEKKITFQGKVFNTVAEHASDFIRKHYTDADMANFARKIAIEFANWYAVSQNASLSYDYWAENNAELFNDKKS